VVNLAFQLAFEDNFVVRYHKDLVPKRRGITFFLLSAVGLMYLGTFLLRAYSE
jgi:hypothetical protein